MFQYVISGLMSWSLLLSASTWHSSSSALEEINERLSCQYVIYPSDISPNGLVIDKEGTWCLADDVVYAPRTANPAITITVSNVTLDLNGKTLSQISKNALYINGIAVQPNVSNITITNGSVSGFSEAGIYINPPLSLPIPSRTLATPSLSTRMNTFVYAGIAQVMGTGGQVSKVTISNIKAVDNGLNTPYAGVNGSGGIVILNSQDVNVYASDCLENYCSGLTAFDVIKLNIQDSHFDDTLGSYLFDNTFPFAAGAFIASMSTGSRDILVQNSTFNRTSSAGFSQGLGFSTFGGALSNISIIDVDALDTATDANHDNVIGAFAAGIAAYLVDNITIDKARVNNSSVVVSGANIPVAQAAGVIVFGNNCSLQSCQATGANLVSSKPLRGSETDGFSFSGRNFRVNDCQFGNLYSENQSDSSFLMITAGVSFFEASNGSISSSIVTDNVQVPGSNTPPSVSLVEGVLIRSSSDIVVEDCIATSFSQSAQNPDGQFSVACGFSASLSERIIFKKCSASNATDNGSGLAYGFSTQESIYPGALSTEIVFESCIAEGNTAAAGIGGGFNFRSVAGSTILHSIADRNTVGIYVSEDRAGLSGNNIIASNTLVGNLQAGIYDATTLLSNAYYSNRAESNGQTPLTTNYFGEIFPEPFCPVSGEQCICSNKTPIRIWQLPLAPCKVNTNCRKHELLDNLSIFRQ